MFILKKIWCRVFQVAFRAALPVLPYREPKIIPSCSELGDVMKKEKVTSALVVTDAGIVKNGLTASLEEVLMKNGVGYTVYDKTQPNPTVDNVEEALSLYVKKQVRGPYCHRRRFRHGLRQGCGCESCVPEKIGG